MPAGGLSRSGAELGAFDQISSGRVAQNEPIRFCLSAIIRSYKQNLGGYSCYLEESAFPGFSIVLSIRFFGPFGRICTAGFP